jgi:hypothetical protein
MRLSCRLVATSREHASVPVLLVRWAAIAGGTLSSKDVPIDLARLQMGWTETGGLYKCLYNDYTTCAYRQIAVMSQLPGTSTLWTSGQPYPSCGGVHWMPVGHWESNVNSTDGRSGSTSDAWHTLSRENLHKNKLWTTCIQPVHSRTLEGCGNGVMSPLNGSVRRPSQRNPR